MIQKQVACLDPRLRVTKSTFICSTEGLYHPNRVSRFLMERNHALPFHFASWEPEPRCTIRILIKTLHFESANFAAPGPAPTCNEQGPSLIRTRERANGFH